MAISRYQNSPRISLGKKLGTSQAVADLRAAIKVGTIPIVKTVIATGDDRLDTLAGALYGDPSFWWVLAAASNIGWGMQIPPGTLINLVRLSDVTKIVS